MTHRELVVAAGAWLKRVPRCGVVVTEYVSYANENPDAFGWNSLGSFLVECKASRDDFCADANKPPRKFPDHCMGNYRFYFVAKGVATVDDLPDGWGLVEVRNGRCHVLRWAAGFRPRFEVDVERRAPLGYAGLINERKMMYSMLRRLAIRGVLAENIDAIPGFVEDDGDMDAESLPGVCR